jgi:hypothetical protein
MPFRRSASTRKPTTMPLMELREVSNESGSQSAVQIQRSRSSSASFDLRRKQQHRNLSMLGSSSTVSSESDDLFFNALRYSGRDENNGTTRGSLLVSDIEANTSEKTQAIAQSFTLPPIPVHYPHQLDTIKEQNSNATLRPLASTPKEVDTSFQHISGEQSRPALRTVSPQARRAYSFSAPTPSPTKRLRILNGDTESNTTSRSSTPTPFFTPASFILPSRISTASPLAPVVGPPERSPTPPGLPTFNTPAAASYHLPPPDLTFRQWFRLEAPPEERTWMHQVACLPIDAVMRGEDGQLVRGRFRVPQSGHTGAPMGVNNISTHPDMVRQQIEQSRAASSTRQVVFPVQEPGETGADEAREVHPAQPVATSPQQSRPSRPILPRRANVRLDDQGNLVGVSHHLRVSSIPTRQIPGVPLVNYARNCPPIPSAPIPRVFRGYSGVSTCTCTSEGRDNSIPQKKNKKKNHRKFVRFLQRCFSIREGEEDRVCEVHDRQPRPVIHVQRVVSVEALRAEAMREVETFGT